MLKTKEQSRKPYENENLYRDALYYSLIHRGVKEERAKLEVERIIKKIKSGQIYN